MSANQPTSFRFPFQLDEKAHPDVVSAIRYSFTGLKDLNDAIRAINDKVTATSNTVTTIQAASSVSPSPPSTLIIGEVNLQPNLTPGAYTPVQTDFGGLILVQSAVAFAITLDSGLMVPFFTTIYNFGTANITATPSTGNVNNAASLTLTPNQFAIVFFDGTNWWAVIQGGQAFSRGGTVLSPAAPVNIIVWFAVVACTVTAVKGYVSGATGSTVNARRNGTLNLLASDITLSSPDTWIDGGAVQNISFAQGDKLEIMLTGISGSPTEIAVQVDFTRP